MTRKTYFIYKFTDSDKLHNITTEEALEYCEKNNADILKGPKDLDAVRRIRATTHRVKDGFQAMFDWQTKTVVDTKGKYNALLKERGLEEVGNETEYLHKEENKVVLDPIASDDMIQGAIDAGADLSGNEIAALKDGTFQDKTYQKIDDDISQLSDD